jgi:hypothetical protein
MGKLVAAAVVVLLVIYLGLPGHWGQSSAWALEKTIKALEPYRAAYLAGRLKNQEGRLVDFEMWMRANPSGTQSQEMLLTTTSGGVVWVDDGKSYQYQSGDNTVYYEDAVTQGISHWFGPYLFTLLGKAEDLEVSQSRDGKRLIMRGSMVNMTGPASWEFDIDQETHLPIRMKQWPNMDRS